MTWSVEIASSAGAAPSVHLPDSIGDVRFHDSLYDFGAAFVTLTSLGGLARPQKDWFIRIIWDRGAATEEVHWEGAIDTVYEAEESAEFLQLMCISLDGLLHQAEAGSHREYLALTPFQIIQGGGTPTNLLTNAQGNVVIPYGSSASVPDRVSAANPGTALGTFAADSKSLLNNVRRLGWQHRYDGSSYGIEWKAQFEGANNSDPRFYLLKRRIRASGYSPETFNIPEDFSRAQRGEPDAIGADAVRIVGAGSGQSMIQSALVGSGNIERVIADKGVFDETGATNFATRFQEVVDTGVEAITAMTWKHGHATRAGDDIIVTQDGKANTQLRVYDRIYLGFGAKRFVFVVGRPLKPGSDVLDGLIPLEDRIGGHETTPQYTDAIGVSGDDPVHANSTSLDAQSIPASEPGTWNSVPCAFNGESVAFDYVDGHFTLFYTQAVDAGIRFRARILEVTGGRTWEAPVSSGNLFVAKHDGGAVVPITARFIVPINATLDASDAYNLQLKMWDPLNGPYTEDVSASMIAVKQHLHN